MEISYIIAEFWDCGNGDSFAVVSKVIFGEEKVWFRDASHRDVDRNQRTLPVSSKKKKPHRKVWRLRDSFAFLPKAKINVLPPSSCRQATVPRTVATYFRVPQFSKNKRPLGGMGKVELFGSGLHPYGMHPETKGLSHGLKKCPPDTFLHQCAHWCRPFESPVGTK